MRSKVAPVLVAALLILAAPVAVLAATGATPDGLGVAPSLETIKTKDGVVHDLVALEGGTSYDFPFSRRGGLTFDHRILAVVGREGDPSGWINSILVEGRYDVHRGLTFTVGAGPSIWSPGIENPIPEAGELAAEDEDGTFVIVWGGALGLEFPISAAEATAGGAPAGGPSYVFGARFEHFWGANRYQRRIAAGPEIRF